MTGDDLTRAILLQIILEEESGGVPMFSTDMLANIISLLRPRDAGPHGLVPRALDPHLPRGAEALSRKPRSPSTATCPRCLFVPGGSRCPT